MRVEKFDGERAVLDGAGLAHQLVQALFGDGAAAIRGDVGAVGKSSSSVKVV